MDIPLINLHSGPMVSMEGEGPTKGTLVDMNVIVAGTNPLATDMVAAKIMGFEPWEIPTF